MEEIIKILLVLILGGVTVISLLAAITLLLPEDVQKTQRQIETGLGRSFLLGLVNTLFLGVISLLFLWLTDKIGGGLLAGITILIAGLAALALATLLLLGLCALASLLGTRISQAGTPFTTSMRGSLLLILAGLAPFIGWFVFTPLVLLVGAGAAVQVLRPRKQKVADAVEKAE